MTYTMAVNSGGTTTIQINFADENVDLQGEISVKGGEAEAMRYLPTFEADLRRNFTELFPVPEMPAMPEGGGL